MSISFTKKSWVMLVLMLLFSMSAFLFVTQDVHADSIKDKIKATQGQSGGMSELETSVDNSTSSLVTTVRRVAIPCTVIMFLWIASLYARGGFNMDALKEAKGKIGVFLIFLALTFWTERILGFIFSVFGVDISSI